MTAYGGGAGDITHVVLTDSRVDAELWIQRKQIPRRAVLVIRHHLDLRGQRIPETARVKRLPSYLELEEPRRNAVELALKAATVS